MYFLLAASCEVTRSEGLATILAVQQWHSCWNHSLKAVGELSGDIGVWKQDCQGDLNQWAHAKKCPPGKRCPTKIEYHSFRCLLVHCGRANAQKAGSPRNLSGR